MKQAKLEYKNKMLSGNDSDAWEGLKRMMVKTTRKYQALVSDNPATFANDFKRFYARYDNIDYRHVCDILCHAISTSPVTLVESDVVRCLSRTDPNKAPGPDGLPGHIMKDGADHISSFFKRFFQFFENTHSMPRSWKQNTIKKTWRKRI